MKKAIVYIILLFTVLYSIPLYATNEKVTTWTGLAPGNWSVYASAAAENNAVVQASQTTLVSACYTNQTTTDLSILVFNSTTVPGDGAVTPIACGPVPKATTSIVGAGCYVPPVPMNLATGLSVAVSTGVNCFSKTTPGPASGMFTVQFK